MDINKSIKLIERWLDIPVEGGLDLDVSNAIELLIEFAKSHQWQPIETAPKDGRYFDILVRHKTNQDYAIRMCNVYYKNGVICGTRFPREDNGEYATHWMQEPQPPKDKK